MMSSLWHDSRLMSLLSGLFSLMAMALLVVAAINWVIHRPEFDLKRMELTGDTAPVNLVGFETQVLPAIEGSFFSVNLNKVREQVESQPWVRKAIVQRAWPNTLRVDIQTHKPLALWGEAQLVNTYGEVFTANVAEATEQQALAQLSGPAGSEMLVSRMYVDSALSLAAIGLVPTTVALSDRYGWTFETAQGIRLELGREQEDMGVEDKLARLKRIFPTIQARLMETMEVIDMRYPRGVAIKGKRMPAPAAG